MVRRKWPKAVGSSCDWKSRAFAGRSGFHQKRNARRFSRGTRSGFTLIELLVVMAIIALLLTIALPRYWHSTDRAKESVLKQDLAQIRIAIDQYHADRGKYPDRLEDLVEKKYLRTVPRDPLTESPSTWVVVSPSEATAGAVYDIKSGASGTASDGRNYSEW
jgi:general secretion pathway protein G